MKRKKLVTVTALAIGLATLAYRKKKHAEHRPHAVDQINLERYLGQWYEIAHLPNYFQKTSSTDTTASYRLNPDQTIAVKNRCLDPKGRVRIAQGTAYAQNKGKSELKVSFLPKGLKWLPCSKGDYWVLRIDSHYQTALVGDGAHKYLWLLSRTPTIAQDTYDSFIATAKEQGFPVEKLHRTQHTRSQ